MYGLNGIGEGEKEFRKAISINPNDAMSRIYYAHLLITLNRLDEALIQGRIAVELDPKNPLILRFYSVVLISNGEWETALRYLNDALEIDPNNIFAWSNYDMIAYRCNEFEKAFNALLKTKPFDEDNQQVIEELFEEKGIEAVYEEYLHRMEVKAQKEFVGFFGLEMRYSILNKHDKVLDWFEKGLEIHEGNMPNITTGFFNTGPLLENPRYIASLEKMNLPLQAPE